MRQVLAIIIFMLPAAVFAQVANPGKPLPDAPGRAIPAGLGATNLSATNMQAAFVLEKLSLSGSLKKDNWGLYYNMNLGLSWQVGGDSFFTRFRTDNVEIFDTFSLLGKYNFITLGTPRVHPYVILVTDLYAGYPDGEGHTAGRIQWGSGCNFNLISTDKIIFRIEGGIDITHELSTGLPSLVFWWRSRIRAEMELVKNIRLGGVFVLSEPFRSGLDHWYDYEFSLAYRLTKALSIVGSVRFYDHRVIESNSDRFIHQVSFVYSM